MLIEQYIKHVERYFWDRKQIQKAVDEEKEQRTARKGHTGGGDFAVAEWVELEKKESADRFIEDANHTVVELVKHMK